MIQGLDIKSPSANWYEFLNVYLFLVKIFNTGTKDLVSLYIGACKTDTIGQNWVAAIYLLFMRFAASILSTCTSSNCFYWLTYFFTVRINYALLCPLKVGAFLKNSSRITLVRLLNDTVFVFAANRRSFY